MIEIQESKKYIIPNEKVVFNRDFVCIIGGRGSGKSALLETIAFCFDAHLKSEKPFSLLPFYKNIDADAEFRIHYKDLDGNPISIYTTSIQNKNESPCSYPFLYISQNQIEKFANDRQFLHGLTFETIRTNSTYSEKISSIQNEIDTKLKSLDDNFIKIINQRELLKNID